MARETDRRDPSVNQTTPARTRNLNERAAKVSESLPGLHTLNIESFEAATGNPSLVTPEGAEAQPGSYVERALGHVQSIGTALGPGETQAPEFMADPNVQVPGSGAATVHLHQQYKGTRLFNKGIIIDDRTVVVGSHNRTRRGTTENRDASLILEDEDGEGAAYFKKLFVYGRKRIGATDGLMLSTPLVALPGEAPPPGTVRVRWSEFFPEWREAEAQACAARLHTRKEQR